MALSCSLWPRLIPRGGTYRPEVDIDGRPFGLRPVEKRLFWVTHSVELWGSNYVRTDVISSSGCPRSMNTDGRNVMADSLKTVDSERRRREMWKIVAVAVLLSSPAMAEVTSVGGVSSQTEGGVSNQSNPSQGNTIGARLQSGMSEPMLSVTVVPEEPCKPVLRLNGVLLWGGNCGTVPVTFPTGGTFPAGGQVPLNSAQPGDSNSKPPPAPDSSPEK
jgi:hypothetical protein